MGPYIQQPILSVRPNRLYKLTFMSTPTSFPLYISTSSVGQSQGPYSVGVVGNFAFGSQSLFFQLPLTGPGLYYQAATQALMGNKIIVEEPVGSTAQVSSSSGRQSTGEASSTAKVSTTTQPSQTTEPPLSSSSPADIVCPALVLPDTLLVEGSATMAMFRCSSPALSLVGLNNVTCTPSGQWSGSAPTCECLDQETNCSLQQCTSSSDFACAKSCAQCPCHLGARSGVSFCTPECKCPEAIGRCDSDFECQEDLVCRNISGSPMATCAYSCGPLPSVSKGTLATGELQGLRNDLALLRCDSGYTATGTTMRCTNRGWQGETGSCMAITCPSLDLTDPNLVISRPAVSTVNTTVSFRCLAGYSVNGAASLTCQMFGTWNDVAPTCKPKQCIVLRVPSGSVSSDNVDIGASITVECFQGYTVIDPTPV